jgi:hypothetical protein
MKPTPNTRAKQVMPALTVCFIVDSRFGICLILQRSFRCLVLPEMGSHQALPGLPVVGHKEVQKSCGLFDHSFISEVSPE